MKSSSRLNLYETDIMVFLKKVIFLLCILVVESKSVLKKEQRDYVEITEENTITVPKYDSKKEESKERFRRSVLEPWILFDSDERELYKRSAEERDWFSNYKAIQKNLVLSFLRQKRSIGKEDLETNNDDVLVQKAPKEKHRLFSIE